MATVDTRQRATYAAQLKTELKETNEDAPVVKEAARPSVAEFSELATDAVETPRPRPPDQVLRQHLTDEAAERMQSAEARSKEEAEAQRTHAKEAPMKVWSAGYTLLKA